MKNQVTIIIVNYKVEKELIACISSIVDSKPKVSYEIIVIDNDEKSRLRKILRERFPQVKYIKSPSNIGYGAGNNLGVKHALSDFLFFLNPDTIVRKDAIDNLFNFVKEKKSAGMIAPLLFDPAGNIYPSQGSDEYNLASALVVNSFVNKYFPNNPISKNFIHKDWDKKNIEEFDVVPGTAFMIKKSLFEKAGMFDENFFLFFEEYDLAKRIKKMGYKNYIIPKAEIVHIWEASTKKRQDINKIFSKSRYLFFRKHYGLIWAYIVEVFARLNKTFAILSTILFLSAFLRLYRIGELMPFIGDQGWFYLSARDMVLNSEIPLVGIASSHPWLHQGPLWTYMLAGIFRIFGFNPVNGAYLTIILGIFTVLLVYAIGLRMFSKRIGLISAVLYATSPLIIIHSRTPYHTSPIPLFTLFFIYSLYKLIKGYSLFFPLSILFLSILYNLELATAILWFVLFIVLGYGFWKKTEWIKKIFNIKILIYSFLAFIIPMAPVLIYDFSHNFPQTLKFIIWIGYRILNFFGFPNVHGENQLINSNSIFLIYLNFYQYLIFAANGIVAFGILVFSSAVLFINLLKRKMHKTGFILLTLWIIISLIGYLVNKSPSEAYLPILFPALIYLAAFSFDQIMKIKKLATLFALFICILSAVNIYYIIDSKYFTFDGLNFSNRLFIAEEIVKKTKGRDYNIIGIGEGSQFESFTMNYEYLTWWLGHSPTKSLQKLKYTIYENNKGAFLLKK